MIDAGRPRVVMLAPCTPSPHGTGWEQRAFVFLKSYARWADVELWAEATPDAPAPERFEPSAGLAAAINIVSRPPWTSAESVRAGVLASAASAQLVHVSKLIPAGFRPPGNGVPLVWDLDELPIGVRPVRARSRTLQLAEITRPQLDAGVAASDLVLVSSPLELDPGLLRGRGRVVPNAVPDPARIASLDPAGPMLFVGNLGFAPNLDALLFLAREVLPRLRELSPGARLRVAGRLPEVAARQPILALVREAGAELVENPATMDAAYDGISLCLAPIREGGGTRIKILEAFARGCPVVSTPVGCEGLAVANGRELVVAAGPAAFAEACARLLTSPDAALGRAARACYDTHYSQAAFDQALDTVLAPLLGSTRGT